MNAIATKEWLVFALLLVIVVVSLVPSVIYARRERRDGLRRDSVAFFKRALEDYYNQHEKYPLEFDAGPHHYVVEERDEDEALGWYIRGELENKLPAIAEKDLESDRNYFYRIVHENGHVYYDVCGGTARCGVPVEQ